MYLGRMTTVAEIFETLEYGPAPESPAEAKRWLQAHNATFGHFIAGAWTTPGETFEVINPAGAREGSASNQAVTLIPLRK